MSSSRRIMFAFLLAATVVMIATGPDEGPAARVTAMLAERCRVIAQALGL